LWVKGPSGGQVLHLNKASSTFQEAHVARYAQPHNVSLASYARLYYSWENSEHILSKQMWPAMLDHLIMSFWPVMLDHTTLEEIPSIFSISKRGQLCYRPHDMTLASYARPYNITLSKTKKEKS